ncbi:hypothetical protein M2371_001102 [Buttiauxella sp. BIGb0471]|nr:hypothetical protein [Buttiauxella sp. BIGb0471]
MRLELTNNNYYIILKEKRVSTEVKTRNKINKRRIRDSLYQSLFLETKINRCISECFILTVVHWAKLNVFDSA